MRGTHACRHHDRSSSSRSGSAVAAAPPTDTNSCRCGDAAAGTRVVLTGTFADECAPPPGVVQSRRLVADTSSRRADAAEAAALVPPAPADRPPPLPSGTSRPRPHPGKRSYPLTETAASVSTEDTPLLGHDPPNLESQGGETLSALRKRATYYIPILSWLPSYSAQCLAHDVVAGVTVACLIIPQSLSYASSLVKLDPVYGLYCAFVPSIVYAVLGTSRQLSVGADALISMLVGAAITQQLENNPAGINEKALAADPAVYASILGAFVGMFLLVLGLMRLGFLDSVLSRALLRGFICAVACVIVIEQSIPCLGLDRLPNKPSHGASPLAKAAFVVESAGSAHALTSAVSLGTIAFLISASRIKKWLARLHRAFLLVPEMLVAVIVSSSLCGALCWHTYGLEILGNTGAGRFPWPKEPVLPPFAHIQKLMGSAALIAVIGFVESVVIAKHYAAAHNYPVSPNRELVALGMANLVGSFFLSYPAFGSLARSKINDRAGARTQFSVVVTATCVLLVILFLLPSFRYLPKAVLASMIWVAAFSLLHDTPADFKFIWDMRAWTDLFLLSLTFVTTLAVSVEVGTLLAITLSLVLAIKHTTKPQITILGRVRGTKDQYQSIRDYPAQAEHLHGTLIIKIEEGLHFANTGQLKDRLRRVELFGDFSVHPSEAARLPPVSNVIFDVSSMPSADCSAVQILLEIIQEYHKRHIYVAIVRPRGAVALLFRRAGISKLVGPQNFFDDVAQTISHVETGGGDQNCRCDP